MNCEKAFESILADSPASPELAAHLAECKGCAALARQWKSLKSVKTPSPASPPSETDYRICSAAIARACALRKRRSAIRAAVWLLASAAALLVCATLAFHFLPADEGIRTARQGMAVASAKEPAAAAKKSIAWDSVELDYGLCNLSSLMETTAASLTISQPAQGKTEQADDFPSIELEVPDLTS